MQHTGKVVKGAVRSCFKTGKKVCVVFEYFKGFFMGGQQGGQSQLERNVFLRMVFGQGRTF